MAIRPRRLGPAERPSRLVDIHYRRLERENVGFPEEITLAEALRQALRVQISRVPLREDVRERVQDDVPRKPGDIRCWNNIQAENGAVFGTLCLYRPSELQAVIEARGIRDRLNAFPLDQIGEAGGRDFLRAIAYWMAIEDHFYLIQTPSIQTGAMESYFEWLLRKVDLIQDGQGVRMLVALDRDAVGGDLEDLQSINVGGTFEPPAPAEVDEEAAPRFRAGQIDLRPEAGPMIERRRVGRGAVIADGWNMMYQLIHDERSIEEIEDAYQALRVTDPNASLDIELEFFVRTRRRDEAGRAAKQRALKAISSGLRDMPDGAVTARGKDGIIKGDEIRLKAPRRIQLAPLPDGAPEGAQSTLLALDHTFEQMQVVHRRFLEDERI